MIEPGPNNENFESTPATSATFATKSPPGPTAGSAGADKPPFVANVANVASPVPENVGAGGIDSTLAGSARRRLSNRREHELITFEHAGIRYTAGIGRFDDGGLAEIFLATEKYGTSLDVNARDAAIAASLLLQFGCPSETLRRALTRNANGSPGGTLAQALDIFEGASDD
jgi:hypothetical protein